MRWSDSARSTHQQLIPGRYNSAERPATPRSSINLVPVLFFVCRSENLHRHPPPKTGGTALDHLSEDPAAPYAGSAAPRDGNVARCAQNKLVISKDKHHILWKRWKKADGHVSWPRRSGNQPQCLICSCCVAGPLEIRKVWSESPPQIWMGTRSGSEPRQLALTDFCGNTDLILLNTHWLIHRMQWRKGHQRPFLTKTKPASCCR